MSRTGQATVSVIGIEFGKRSFHIVGHDERGAIVLRQRWSPGQAEARLANMSPCPIGMAACIGVRRFRSSADCITSMSGCDFPRSQHPKRRLTRMQTWATCAGSLPNCG